MAKMLNGEEISDPKKWGKFTAKERKLIKEEDDGSTTIALVYQLNASIKLHNWDKPALVNKQRRIKEYHLFGNQYTYDDWNEIRKGREGLPPSKKPAPKGFTNRS
jgi:hypothetical protein